MSAAQAEARGGMHGALVAESWTERIETAMYGAMIVGYLYAVLAPGHFKLPGFLLLTVSCAAWVALYRYISATVCVRYFKLAFAGVVVTATLAQSAAFWGVSLDWLAPVLTVGFVAAVLSLRWALVLSAGLYGHRRHGADQLTHASLRPVRPGPACHASPTPTGTGTGSRSAHRRGGPADTAPRCG